MVGCHQHLVAGLKPRLQVVGEDHIGAAGAVAVLRGVEAVLVPGVVDVHGVHQQKVRRMAQAQAFGIGEQVRVGVVVGVIKVPMLDGQRGVVGMAIAGCQEGRAVVQFADPMVSGRCRAQAGLGGVVENAALVGQPRDLVVHDAAGNRWHAGEDAFVQGARQGRQFAFELVQGGAAGADIGLQMAHRVLRHLVIQAVEQNQDDVVGHGKASVLWCL
ncbi:hypothetical protein D9M71_622530 [compost metagenome]